MLKLPSRRPKGFTLIEVILVLAIAGLILVIVVLAAGDTQRSRRDHQRKEDLARTLAAIIAWQSNNQGQAPLTQANMDDVLANYLHNLSDPRSGQPYNLTFRSIGLPHGDIPGVGVVFYQQGHWCNKGPQSNPDSASDPIAGTDVSVTKFVVWTGMEVGGNAGASYCLDNNQ